MDGQLRFDSVTKALLSIGMTSTINTIGTIFALIALFTNSWGYKNLGNGNSINVGLFNTCLVNKNGSQTNAKCDSDPTNPMLSLDSSDMKNVKILTITSFAILAVVWLITMVPSVILHPKIIEGMLFISGLLLVVACILFSTKICKQYTMAGNTFNLTMGYSWYLALFGGLMIATSGIPLITGKDDIRYTLTDFPKDLARRIR